MPKQVQDAIAVLESMLKLLSPGRKLTDAEAKRRDALLKGQADKLSMSRAIIEHTLQDAIRDVNAETRALAQLNHDLNTMLRTLNWLDSARAWETQSDAGAVVQNAKAMMVTASKDLKKSVDAHRAVASPIDDLDHALGL